MVRAKFKVDSIILNANNDGSTDIRLSAVTGDSPENKTYWKYTPAGQIHLGCLNPEATKQFELSKEFYIDFVPVV